MRLAERGWRSRPVARSNDLNEAAGSADAIYRARPRESQDSARRMILNVVAEKLRAFGRIDALVNNAGYAPLLSVEQTTDQAWKDAIDMNLSAAFYLSRGMLAALQARRRRDRERLVGGGARSVSGFVAYGAAKAAINNLGLSLCAKGRRTTSACIRSRRRRRNRNVPQLAGHGRLSQQIDDVARGSRPRDRAMRVRRAAHRPAARSFTFTSGPRSQKLSTRGVVFVKGCVWFDQDRLIVILRVFREGSGHRMREARSFADTAQHDSRYSGGSQRQSNDVRLLASILNRPLSLCAPTPASRPLPPPGMVNLPYTTSDTTGNQWMIYQGGWMQQPGNQPVYSQSAMTHIDGNPLQSNTQPGEGRRENRRASFSKRWRRTSRA